MYDIKEAKLHISKGNSKLGDGVYNFSTLPGNAEHLLKLKSGEILTNIPGTCSENCKNCFSNGCYAVRSVLQYHNAVLPPWAENTLLLRSGRFFDELEKYIDKENSRRQKIKIFRINCSGEIESVDELFGWNKIAKRYPEIQFSIYTKNYSDLELFFNKENTTADNFVINVSQWSHCADDFLKKYRDRVNVFTYDDSNSRGNHLTEEDKKYLAGLTHCPAVLPNGKRNSNVVCIKCQRCYKKTGKETAVYAH